MLIYDDTEKLYFSYKKAMDKVRYIDQQINRIGKEEQHKLTYEMSGAAIPKKVGTKTLNKQRLEKKKHKIIARLDAVTQNHFLKENTSQEVKWEVINNVKSRYVKETNKELEDAIEYAFQELEKRKQSRITQPRDIEQSQERANNLLTERKEADRNSGKKMEMDSSPKTKEETTSYNFSLEIGLNDFDKISNDKPVSEKDYNYSLELNFEKFDNIKKDKPIFEKETDKDNLSAMPYKKGNYNYSLNIGFDSSSETIEVSNPDKNVDKGIDMDR
jgi:hypothetical protein